MTQFCNIDIATIIVSIFIIITTFSFIIRITYSSIIETFVVKFHQSATFKWRACKCDFIITTRNVIPYFIGVIVAVFHIKRQTKRVPFAIFVESKPCKSDICNSSVPPVYGLSVVGVNSKAEVILVRTHRLTIYSSISQCARVGISTV